MLNSTKILRFIEKNLGYKFTELELEPDEIIEDIKQFTLPDYSKYFPYIVPVNIDRAEKVDGKVNRFLIDTKGLDIMSVNRIVTGNMEYVDPSIITRPSAQTDIFGSILSADVYSMVRNPITFKFFPPNVVEVYPAVIGLTTADIYVNCVHPDHFGTIATNMEDQFLQLAVLDVKMSLYQIRHRFANLSTPYGSIELFIDDLQDAESKRDELIEKWSANYLKNANRTRLYIY